MKSALYKQQKNKLVCGICTGTADESGWDLPLACVLATLLMYSYGSGTVIYILLAIFLPYKEDITRDHYGAGSRRHKDAEAVDEDDDNDSWFW